MPNLVIKKRSHRPLHREVENYLIALTTIQELTPHGKDRPLIEKFVLENGMYFKPAPLPRGIPHGDIHNCFTNAFLLGVKNREKYTYCEGFASTGLIPPLFHSWLVTDKGIVVDPTWAPDGSNSEMEYYGIPFNWVYVAKQFKGVMTFNKGVKTFSLIKDTKGKWPLLRGEKDFRSKKF